MGLIESPKPPHLPIISNHSQERTLHWAILKKNSTPTAILRFSFVLNGPLRYSFHIQSGVTLPLLTIFLDFLWGCPSRLLDRSVSWPMRATINHYMDDKWKALSPWSVERCGATRWRTVGNIIWGSLPFSQKFPTCFLGAEHWGQKFSLQLSF